MDWSKTMAVGRPAKFRNGAEKQKAYRERKKQAGAIAEALRKSEWQNSIEGLAEAVDVAHENYEAHQRKFQMLHVDDVPEWSRGVSQLCDAWWEAHSRWYKAWKEAGYPADKKPKSSSW